MKEKFAGSDKLEDDHALKKLLTQVDANLVQHLKDRHSAGSVQQDSRSWIILCS